MYRLGNTKNFTKAASFKLYINLKQRENVGHWEVALEEIRFRLGVAGKYSRWQSVKERLLNPALKEINEHSDLHVTWTAERYGRRIDKIIFKICKKAEIEAKRAKAIHEMNEMNDEIRKAEIETGIDRVGLGDQNCVPKLPGQMSIADGIRGANTKGDEL